MKLQLAIFGCLVALAACKPAEDTGMAQLLLRSCDRNADSALNAAEFAGCLMQTSWQQRMAARGMAISRSELLQSFMDEADLNNDLRADGKELQEWSKRWFISDLIGGNDDDDDDDDDNDDDDGGLTFGAILGKVVVILQYISEEEYASAVIELYALIAGYELSTSSQVSIRFAITAIEDGDYGEAVGYIYSVIKDIAGGEEAGGIFVVTVSTVTNVASLLQAVIEDDSTLINYYIYRSLAGIIVDFSFLSQESASAVAAFIQAVIEDNTDEFYASLKVIIKDIPGISSETSTALTELLEAVSSGESSEVSVKIFAVLSSILKEESINEIVQIFVSGIQALVDGDTEKAIELLAIVYAKISGGSGSGSGLTSKTVIAFGAIIEAVQDGNSNSAISEINILIDDLSSGLSSSQIDILLEIIELIEDGDDDDAIAELIALATSSSSSSSSGSSSGGGSSSGSSSVEISVDVFLALSSVISAIEDSDDADEIIDLIEEILSDSSITISVEVRSTLTALITVLSEESTDDALVIITSILTGSDEAYDRTISDEVASALEDAFTAVDDEDSDRAIEIIEALLDGEQGGSTLSIVVQNDLRMALSALESGDYAYAYSLLSVISVGSMSSSLSSSMTAGFLTAVQLLSSSSRSDAIAVLELLLEEDGIESSLEEEIESIISSIRASSYGSARNEILGLLFESSYSFSSSVSNALYTALRLVLSSDFDGAIKTIEGIFDDLSAEVRLLFMIIIRLLRTDNLQGSLNLVNFIIALDS